MHDEANKFISDSLFQFIHFFRQLLENYQFVNCVELNVQESKEIKFNKQILLRLFAANVRFLMQK